MSTIFSLLNPLSLHQKLLLAVFIALKVLLILMVPLTGDEAYFIVWGQMPAIGYYDHPPAVGWVLAAMSQVTDDLTWYRSFAFVSAILISILLYKLVLLHGRNQQLESQHRVAFWVAMVFFISPISLMFVVTANDTVLVFFSIFGVYFFAKNIQFNQWLDAVWAGLFLALAFLSKYFAAFMLIGLLAYSIWHWQKVHRGQFVLMLALVLVAIAENLYFNATHCWNNILFNFFSRTEEAEFAPQNLVNFILMMGVLLSPLGLWYLFKSRHENNYRVHCSDLNVVRLAWVASLPLILVLMVVSLNNPIGLHWPLIAVTLLYVIYLRLEPEQLSNLYLFNGYFSVLAGAVLIIALANVESVMSDTQKPRVAVYTQPEKVCEVMAEPDGFFTLDYSSQSALSYHCANDNVHVFASTSKYGREDDKHTDFKAMDGHSFSILVTKQKELKKVTPFFDSHEIKELTVDENVTYFKVSGKGFDYDLYREKILLTVNEKFYSPPEWLKPLSQHCGFKQKYDLP